jgi:hypothetical protein
LYSILLGGEQFLTKLNEITGNCKFPATFSFLEEKLAKRNQEWLSTCVILFGTL